MDELEISGRRYISSARAAKEHKYHADYIGQLVRKGSVAGQKVGRAWYVDAGSLSEYLRKEAPPRGPMVHEKEKINKFVTQGEMEESSERPVAEPAEARGLSEDSPQSQSNNFSPDLPEEETRREFIMPLRKSGRSHVIAAIETPSIKNIPEKKVQPIVEALEEIIEEPQEMPEMSEETFIPLKITQQITEPEDSFYKIPPHSLRYVRDRAPVKLPEKNMPKARAVSKSALGMRLLQAAGVIVAAGALSLGAGIVASYYLHSITTIEGQAQTSGIVLSQ